MPLHTPRLSRKTFCLVLCRQRGKGAGSGRGGEEGYRVLFHHILLDFILQLKWEQTLWKVVLGLRSLLERWCYSQRPSGFGGSTHLGGGEGSKTRIEPMSYHCWLDALLRNVVCASFKKQHDRFGAGLCWSWVFGEHPIR